MSLVPEIIEGDWKSIEYALRKLAKRIDATSTPTFGGLTIDGETISSAIVGNWNDAYSWGDHALAGYISSVSGGDHSTLANLDFASAGHTGFQELATNLTSLAGLTFASTSFVKMSAAGTFALDTNEYYKSGDSVSFADITLVNLTASQALMTDADKKLVSVDYLNQAVKTTSSVTFGGITNSALHSGYVTLATTAGLLTDSANLTFATNTLSLNYALNLVNTSTIEVANLVSGLSVRRTDGATTSVRLIPSSLSSVAENVGYLIAGKIDGWPTFSNVEYLSMGYNTTLAAYIIATVKAGTNGSYAVRPLKIYTGTNTSQLILNIDGTITTNGLFTSNTGFSAGGYIGASGAVDVAKVGGGTRSLIFVGGLYISYSDS